MQLVPCFYTLTRVFLLLVWAVGEDEKCSGDNRRVSTNGKRGRKECFGLVGLLLLLLFLSLGRKEGVGSVGGTAMFVFNSFFILFFWFIFFPHR